MGLVEQQDAFYKSGAWEQEGDGLWEAFLKIMGFERDKVVRYSTSTMKAISQFSGFFVTTLAIFLVDSHKSLSPVASAQTSDAALTNALLAQMMRLQSSSVVPMTAADIEPFRPTKTAVVVNTLWYLSLIITLLGAVLAMMVQDWLKDSLPTVQDDRPLLATIQQHSLNRLRSYTALERYGVDRLATCVVGLIHSAVVLFLVGLSLYVFPLHSTPGLAVAVASGLGALLYTMASVAPLIDRMGPYYTPLSRILAPVLYSVVTFGACTFMYLVVIKLAVGSWIRRKRVILEDIDPRYTFAFMKFPTESVQTSLFPMCRALHSTERRERILALLQDPPEVRPNIAGQTLTFLATRTQAYWEEHPDGLRYMARCLLSMERQGDCEFFVYLRQSSFVMSRLVIVLQDIDSVLAAVGAIRSLQILLWAERGLSVERLPVHMDDQWRNMGPILDAFPAFAKQVGERVGEAEREKDIMLHAALASFRWTLIRSLSAIQAQGRSYTSDQRGFVTKTNLHSMLITLDSIESLRMRAVFRTAGHLPLETLLQDSSKDHSLELSARNAFTLLDAVRRCDWRGDDWKRPDRHYIRKGMPGLWEWHRLYGCSHSGPKLAASEGLCELMNQDRVRASMQGDSPATVQDDIRLDPVAVHALRDLASIVDAQSLLPAPMAVAPAEYEIESAGDVDSTAMVQEDLRLDPVAVHAPTRSDLANVVDSQSLESAPLAVALAEHEIKNAKPLDLLTSSEPSEDSESWHTVSYDA
ncbi:unnamed protein product [Peniophora sp. CBMAI 1063]|nr:unnamed protein product [Peniophora sp. CBMAI 1063]